MKKICAISGSPRKNGNTEKMIKHITNGSDYELIRLYDSNINPCVACEGCRTYGKCVIGDDMGIITAKMKEADILIFGTPVYWWSVSAGFKSFMDRWYSEETRSAITGKKVILAIPMADTEDATAKWTVGSLKDSLDYIGANVVKTFVGKGFYGPDDLEKDKDFINKLKTALE